MHLGKVTTRDGAILHTVSWPAPGEIRADAILVHGYGEHSGRYQPLASVLNAAGVSVHSFDLRGMGRSTGPAGRIDSFDRLESELATVIAEVPVRDVPRFGIGHSLGGLLLLRHLLSHQDEFAGAVLSAPAIYPRPVLPGVIRRMISLLARVAPSLPVMTVRRRLLSRDPAIVDAARHDPYSYPRLVDARTATEFAAAGFDFADRTQGLRLPILILQGSADGIVDARGAYELFDHTRSEDKSLIVFEGGFHEPLNDIIRDDAIRCVVEWIDERIDQRMSNVS